MSDETVNYDTNTTTADARSAAQTAGFCQDCGRPLSNETRRNVGAAVFCEPCLAARVATAPPAYAVGPLPGQPHPVFAALLGVIFPGAGACYNGQYAKGLVHLIIFVVLVSMANHISGIFGLFVAGWILYQGFDAYHTAKARMEGLPLPNPFGFNDIGERMGFGRSWGVVPNPAAGAPASAAAPATGATDWVGYVPPSNFASAPAASASAYGSPFVAPETAPETAQAVPPGHVPYAETYTGGVAGVDYATAAQVPVVDLMANRRQFPVGALWLVGLGLLFLLGEFAPEWGWEWNLSGRWLLPVFFAGLSLWLFTRRIAAGLRSIRGLRAAIFLMALAILFAFQAADVASLARTWPVLLIVFGVVLIAERTALNTAGFSTTPAASFVPPPVGEAEAEAARRRAAWSDAPGSAVVAAPGAGPHADKDGLEP